MAHRRDASASAATWQRHARRYARQERWETAAIDAALAVAAPQRHERLVELATGTGLVLRRLAGARADHPREAVGVDQAPAMLARVGELPPGWTVIAGDARRVPLPDGWADVVTCSYLLHLLDAHARAEVLAEARRLLAPRPSSRLVVVTVWSPRAAVRAALALLARARPGGLGGLHPLDPGPELAGAGFALARRVVLPHGGYPSLVLGAKPRARS